MKKATKVELLKDMNFIGKKGDIVSFADEQAQSFINSKKAKLVTNSDEDDKEADSSKKESGGSKKDEVKTKK